MKQHHVPGGHLHADIRPDVGMEGQDVSPDGGTFFRFNEEAAFGEPSGDVEFDEETVLSNSRERNGVEALVPDSGC